MVVLGALEWIFATFFIWFIFTQVVFPYWNETHLFPLFRLRKVSDEKKDINDRIEEACANNDVDALKKELEALREKK